MMRVFKLALLVSVFGLTACAVGPDYQKPEANFLDRWFAADDMAGQTGVDINPQWWENFNDPLLSRYISAAVANNKDVQIALANVGAARALRRETRGGFYPSIGADGSYERSKSSDTLGGASGGQVRNLYDAGFDASWALDVFGGTRRAAEAANARAEGAVSDYHAALLTTMAEVARTYYEARGQQKRIAITRQNVELFKKSYNLIDDRVRAGEASSFDLSRARGEYELTQARLPNLEAELQASVYSLSVLLGLPPEALLNEMQEAKPLPATPDIVPVGLRSDILRRRPDVRSAERELAANVADIGVQTADLFPRFSITGALGSQARTFGDLFTSAAGLWSFGPSISWPLFEGGAIRARIDASEALSEAQLARYEKTVLEALADAESALVRYGQELETHRRLGMVLDSRREAAGIARELFNSGEEDYLAVLDAERELRGAEDEFVLSETQAVLKLITLYQALGGGWEAALDMPSDEQVALIQD